MYYSQTQLQTSSPIHTQTNDSLIITSSTEHLTQTHTPIPIQSKIQTEINKPPHIQSQSQSPGLPHIQSQSHTQTSNTNRKHSLTLSDTPKLKNKTNRPLPQTHP